MTDFVLNETNNGALLPGAPANGRITDLKMDTPPDFTSFDGNINNPWWFLSIGGADDSNWGVINIDLLHAPSAPALHKVDLPYRGEFAVRSVPRGSQFTLTLEP